jgi:BASS family bile acid:Na+ symporter
MIELGIPLLVFLLMFIIGASIDITDLVKMKAQSNQVLILTAGQIFLLPITAWLIIKVMQPPPIAAAGMLLISLCPGGAVSNIYSFLAKGNVVLSVTLTVLNGLLSVILLPLLVLTVFPAILSLDHDIYTLIKKQSLQLIISLFVPVTIGIFCRYIKTKMVIKMMPTLERIGGAGLLLLLLSIFIQFHEKVQQQLSSLVTLALLFTFASLLIALILSKMLKVAKSDEAVVLIEFPVRNLALAALIAVNIFQNVDYLLFSAVFFVIQTPIMLSITFWYRSKL